MKTTVVSHAPPSWGYVELSRIVQIHYGKALPGQDRVSTGRVPVVGSSGKVGFHDKTLVDGPCLVVGRKGAAGSVHFISESCWPIDTAYFIQPPPEQNLQFLFYFLGLSNLSELDKSTAIPSLSRDDLYRVLIPVPPILEQSRIVDKLEELLSDLDAGVAELKTAQKKLAQYRQSLLKAAVEGRLTEDWRARNSSNADSEESGAQLLARILRERRARWEAKQLAKFEAQGKAPSQGWQQKYPEPRAINPVGLSLLPQGWVWASLDQLASTIRNGLSRKPSVEPIGYPILRINAVRAMAVNLAEVRFLSITRDEAVDYALDEGDLLATRYNGSVDLLGVVGVVRGLKQPTVHPDKLIRIKPVLTSLLADWIEICAAVGSSRAHVVSRVKTTAGQKGISGDDIKKMPIPLAPIAEQKVGIDIVAAALQEIVSQGVAITLSLRQSAAQRKNILQSAFSGQLVPQDPNDEPASVLLARIRAERAARETTNARSRLKKKAVA